MTVGRFTQRSLLGRGGMGEVYRAHDERLRRWVALKRIQPAAAPLAGRPGPLDDQRRARLEREARPAAQLTHPAIVAVFDVFEDGDGDWVVMELVDGETLAAELAAGPFAIADALACAIAIAGALGAAHRQ
ncbi:MAG TPA: protein kinase, partial [Kofleriaceae bacterium]